MVSVREKKIAESGKWAVLVIGRVQFSVGQSGSVVLTEKRAIDET